jgi:hypothetical protein
MGDFFDGMVRSARDAGLINGVHFSVAWPLIQSHASQRRLKRIDR